MLRHEHQIVPTIGLPELGRFRILAEKDIIIQNDISDKHSSFLQCVEAVLHDQKVNLIAILQNSLDAFIPDSIDMSIISLLVPLLDMFAHTPEVEVAAAHRASSTVVALLIPFAYTAMTELMSADKLALRNR